MAQHQQAREGEALEILLVEDDDGDALLVSDDLAEALPGARLTRCTTLARALALAAGQPLDCVLLDLGLPDVCGMGALAQLRARLGSVPLVVLTGLADEAAGVEAVRSGAQDYLVKGRLEPGQLARAIRYAIGRRLTAAAERELALAEAHAREVERLERGLAPPPVVTDEAIWACSCNRPGRNRALLGGDFFDLVQDGEVLHAVVGDVCGHGADEAALGVSLRAAWRALTLSGAGQQELVATLHEVLVHERRLPRLFATLCSLRVELASGTMRMVLAGHPRPLLIADGEVRRLEGAAGAPAIGLSGGPWPADTLELPSGWALLLYTDGIIEGRVGAGPERLGEEGLMRSMRERVRSRPSAMADPGALLEELLGEAEALNDGPLLDDVAMLLLGMRERPAAAS